MARNRSPSHLFSGSPSSSHDNVLYGKISRTQETSPPPDFFGLSVLTSVCCFLPLGLVALYFSFKTRRCVENGDINMADKYSHLAFISNMVAVGAAFLSWMSLFFLLYSQESRVPIYELHNKFTLTQAFNMTP